MTPERQPRVSRKYNLDVSLDEKEFTIKTKDSFNRNATLDQTNPRFKKALNYLAEHDAKYAS